MISLVGLASEAEVVEVVEVQTAVDIDGYMQLGASCSWEVVEVRRQVDNVSVRCLARSSCDTSSELKPRAAWLLKAETQTRD